MRVHRFNSEIWLPQSREKVFAFFSDAANLDAITPPWLKFHTVTPRPIDLHLGTLIDYKLRIHGFQLRWRSEITAWEPPSRFVDEQVRGPYRLWIHEHTFAERDQGTVVTDCVHYAVPFDWLVHRILVRPDVEQIFAYRTKKLREKFS
jgi:ligand-binding SRPBCC domain-containing protein